MRRYGVLVGVLVAMCATGCGLFYGLKVLPASQSAAAAATYATPEEKDDVYVRFVMEAYDVIQKNYWQKAEDAQLANLFQLSLQKAASTTTAPIADRAALAKTLDSVFQAQASADAKKQLAASILQVALYNLAPNGRSELMSAQAQKELQNTVNNVNPNSNLYSELGVDPSASADQIQKAYAAKKTELEASSSPDAAKELARAEYVKDTLTNPTTKERYDTTKSETTVSSRTMGSTLYLGIGKMSPTTVADVTAALDAASSSPTTSLIIDLRGNIGGALDQGPSLIGMFQGMNQYVFDLYHQSDFQVIRSPIAKLPELAKYKEVAILTDSMTQSTAEVMTAAMKRFHLATVVGTNTRGWGTVEGQYPLTTKMDDNTTYALLLVYALTLRDDNQPIDGVGVDPDVSIKDKNWQGELSQHIRSQSLISAVQTSLAKPPLQ